MLVTSILFTHQLLKVIARKTRIMQQLEIRSGNAWRVIQGIPHLFLCENNPSQKLLDDFATLPIMLGLYREDDVHVLVYKFGNEA